MTQIIELAGETTIITASEGPAGQGVPAGGSSGQVLRKVSNDDYDTEWASSNHSHTATEVQGVVASNSAGVTGADAVTNIISLTQTEYDAIGTPNASTLYVITG